MNILFCKYNHICEPGIIRGFEHLGHRLIFPEHSLGHPDMGTDYARHLSDCLLNHKIDFVFSINYAPIISQVCQIHGIPYASWIVSCPLVQLYSDTLANPVNYVFVFDYTEFEEFYPKNPEHIFYLPLGCDLDLWDSIKITPEDHAKYACDVSFIGSLYTEKCNYNHIEQDLSDYLKGFFKGILTAQTKIYGYNFLRDVLSDEIMNEYRSTVNINYLANYRIDDHIILGNLILNEKCTEMERIYLLNAIARHFPIDFYTQSDVSQLIGVNCRGSASSCTDMPKIFKCSKINLNLTARGIQSGAAQRIFDILGCKGFLISNYQAELPELFEDGKDLVLFESEKDLLEKIHFYLQHEERRQEIAEHGYKKIQEYYSYTKRLEYMLEALPA